MKLGIIGAGMIVKELLSITPLLKELELEAICGTKRNEENMNQLKDKYLCCEIP